MKSRRLAGFAALGAAVLLAAPATTASADETTVEYAAQGSGHALDLQLFGNAMTVGQTVAGLDSTLTAVAEGTGLATPLVQSGVSSARISGEGTDGSTDEICDASLPEIPGVSLALACSSSIASVIDGIPTSTATGRVGTIAVSPVPALRDTTLGAVVGPVESAVDTLVDSLAAITGPVDDTLDLGIQDTIETVIDDLFGGADLVSIQLGSTVSKATAGDVVSGSCVSNGGRIDILGAAGGTAVASIVIGSGLTSVNADPTDGAASASVDPAIATVIVPSLGINQAVGPGESTTFELPLLGSSTIRVADGVTGVDENGQTFARADGVLLDLLNGDAMMGGVELSIAGCAAVAGAMTTIAPTAVPTPEPTPLPRTGGGAPNGLLVAAMALGGLGFALVRRSASASI